jgi:hypothetical protein
VPGTDRIVLPIDHFSGAGVSIADRMDLHLTTAIAKRRN